MTHISARILNATCHLSGYTRDTFLRDLRTANISCWRAAAMYVARQSGMSFPDIGARFNRDHSTVVYACKRVAGCEYRLALAWQVAIAVKAAPVDIRRVDMLSQIATSAA
jgi:hypothetical protein